MINKLKRKIIRLLIGLIILIFIGLCLSKYHLNDKNDENTIYLAMVGPMTGQGEQIGKSLLQGVTLYLDLINKQGGIHGKTVKLDVYDDQNNKDLAKEKAIEIVQKKRALAVIGHYYSSCSISGGEIYRKHHVPAITPGSTNVMVTRDNEWYFRTLFNDNLQGRFLANYSKKVLKQNTVSIIYDDDAYGYYLSKVFEDTSKDLGVNVVFKAKYNNKDAQLKQTIQETIKQLKQQTPKDTGVIFLAAHAHEGIHLVKCIKDEGLENPIITPDAFASKSFQMGFDNFTNEVNDPGYYSNGIYTTTPLIFDTANEMAQTFKEMYQKIYDDKPDWRAAFAYDSAMIILEAARQSRINGTLDAIEQDRKKIKDFLTNLTHIGDAIKGVTGFNYFDSNGDSAKPVSIGMYKNKNVISSSIQLQVIHKPKKIHDLQDALDQERILSIDGKLMYKTNVVYTGVLFHEIKDLDMKKLTCTLDFTLWFRFQGNINPDCIAFLGGDEENISIGEPITAKNIKGITYQQYRVKGRFKADFLPVRHVFGQHILGVSFHHKTLSRNNLIYVVDVVGMKLTHDNQNIANMNETHVLSPITGWSINGLVFYQDILQKDSAGDPDYINLQGIIEFSRFNVGIRIKKNQISIRGSISAHIANKLVFVILFVLIVLWVMTYQKMFKKYKPFIMSGQFFLTIMFIIVIEVSVMNLLVDRLITYHLQVIQIFFDMLWWIIPAFFLNTAIDQFVWNPLEEQTGRKVPDIARMLFVVVIYMLASFGIIAFVFDQKINGLLATSGMIAMVIGLAVQINISNIFSGIAIHIERPFRTGDWVQIGKYDEGQVVDISWRSTMLLTRNECILNIPNSTVSESEIQNFHYPDNTYRSWFRVHIEATSSPDRIRKVLLDAVLSTEEVLHSPEPSARFVGFTEWGADYLISYSAKDYGNKLICNESVWYHVWVHLNRAGIKPAIKRQKIHISNEDDAKGEKISESLTLLNDVDIFKTLSDVSRQFLSKRMTRHFYPHNETIFNQGDEGHSLFIISEGVVAVWIQMDDKSNLEIVRLGAGNFFGEVALLTGEKRTATIVTVTDTVLYEITKEHISPLIKGQKEIARQLSDELTKRIQRTEHIKDAHEAASLSNSSERLSNIFLSKILRYFGIKE